MSVRRVARLLPLSLLPAAVLAGCGGDDGRLTKAEYEQEIGAAIEENLGASMFELGRQTARPTSKEHLLSALREAAADFEEAGDEIDALSPPSEVADLHPRLVGGIRKFGQALAQLAENARSETLTAAHGRLQAFFFGPRPAWSKALDQLAKEFQRRGYEVTAEA